jgi:Uma2 family endonuclease
MRENMSLHEIVLPETKPETEWVRGRALRKMSPTRHHSRLQGALYRALDDWGALTGEVGTEWRFRLAPPGMVRRPLVPDVSYTSNERLRPLSDDEIAAPPLAPNVAVEILSPGDRRADVEDKIAVYLVSGTALVILIDPKVRSATLIDSVERRTLSDGEVLRHPALPGFSLPLAKLFAVLERPK